MIRKHAHYWNRRPALKTIKGINDNILTAIPCFMLPDVIDGFNQFLMLGAFYIHAASCKPLSYFNDFSISVLYIKRTGVSL